MIRVGSPEVGSLRALDSLDCFGVDPLLNLALSHQVQERRLVNTPMAFVFFVGDQKVGGHMVQASCLLGKKMAGETPVSLWKSSAGILPAWEEDGRRDASPTLEKGCRHLAYLVSSPTLPGS